MNFRQTISLATKHNFVDVAKLYVQFDISVKCGSHVMHAKWVEIISEITLQLRDPKNDFIFNFNFDDKVKNL